MTQRCGPLLVGNHYTVLPPHLTPVQHLMTTVLSKILNDKTFHSCLILKYPEIPGHATMDQ